MTIAAISALARFLMVVLFFAYLKRVMLNPYMRRYRKEMKRQDRLAKAGIPIEVSETAPSAAKANVSSDDELAVPDMDGGAGSSD